MVLRPFEQVTGTWRIGSLRYGMKYGVNKLKVLSSFFREGDYWLKTPYGTFHCPDIASAWQFSDGWESKVKEIIGSLKDSFFVDVGANIGVYSLMAARNDNKVFAIEPDSRAYGCLFDNLQANQAGEWVYPKKAAAWSSNGRLKLKIGRHSDISQVHERGNQEVEAIRLDEVLNQRPGLMKIDAEGSEPHILRGLMGILSWRFPIIFEALTDAKLDECHRILWPFDYRIKQLDGTNFHAC